MLLMAASWQVETAKVSLFPPPAYYQIGCAFGYTILTKSFAEKLEIKTLGRQVPDLNLTTSYRNKKW
ncbi:hypothetical protein PR048_015961 [Dryococelus australis]|uniref:Uncharacterized protein n=1 Tax=Dryococelus australis TaxID=614101 RepID=A0ABQ9HIG2_9NEOP|nr:hypothetical protein PR048_015961 [Dryococelus australis]